MISHREKRVMPYPADLMYSIVADVEQYPKFLPWVVALRVLSRRDNGLTAEIAVGYRGLRERYTSDVMLAGLAASCEIRRPASGTGVIPARSEFEEIPVIDCFSFLGAPAMFSLLVFCVAKPFFPKM